MKKKPALDLEQSHALAVARMLAQMGAPMEGIRLTELGCYCNGLYLTLPATGEPGDLTVWTADAAGDLNIVGNCAANFASLGALLVTGKAIYEERDTGNKMVALRRAA